MSRKSKIQRINEGNALIATIKQDAVLAKEQAWLLHFLGDLVAKFSRGKGGTARQRQLFDDKIAAGAPARKVNTHTPQPKVIEAEAAIKVLQTQTSLYQWEIRVGGEIVANGLKYNLSTSQLALLDGFISKAKEVAIQLEATVSQEDIATAQLVCSLSATYVGLTQKNAKTVGILQYALDNNIGFTASQLQAGLKAVSGQKKKWDKYNRQYPAGSMVKLKGAPVLVLEGPAVIVYQSLHYQYSGRTVSNASILVPVLQDGAIFNASPTSLSKYTKKELKALGIK
jgi:hypothetical protein